jgi:antitoxin (DNA-binding transcriptional repressor) of toxin-antitoxin stability system
MLIVMRTVKIGDFKAHLSAHLQYVQDGEEVLVCDRDKPVARVVPCSIDDYSEQERRLIARGVLRAPMGKRRISLPKPVGKQIPNETMRRVWQEERVDR